MFGAENFQKVSKEEIKPRNLQPKNYPKNSGSASPTIENNGVSPSRLFFLIENLNHPIIGDFFSIYLTSRVSLTSRVFFQELKGWIQKISHIWGFPKIGVPPNHPF